MTNTLLLMDFIICYKLQKAIGCVKKKKKNNLKNSIFWEVSVVEQMKKRNEIELSKRGKYRYPINP